MYIPEKTRGTICVSSQVGCSLTCRFCRSGTQKLVKNLKASEIVSQIILVKDKLKDWGDQKIVSNIVFISSNDLASGPGVSSVGESGKMPSVGHTSYVPAGKYMMPPPAACAAPAPPPGSSESP